MKKKHLVLAVLIGSIFIVNTAWRMPQDKRDIQAILVKVINNVEKKETAKGWTTAIPLDKLRSGYEVRTQAKSVAVVLFSDQSKLIVREKSIAEIKGQVQGKQVLDRNVHMARGGIRFDVKKGEKEQFRFSSPISVASIRGTSGLWNQTEGFSTFIMNTGGLDLTSLISNRSEIVNQGFTGVADSTGNLLVRESTKDEQTDATQTDEETEKKKHELLIPGEDKDGKKKVIKIQWEE